MVVPQPIQVANISMADSIILMVLALVVFGPRRLPQIGRQIGKLMYEFRKASNDFKFQMEEELRLAEEADRRKKEEAERQRLAALSAPAEPPAPTADTATITAESATETSTEAAAVPSEPSPELAGDIPRLQPPTTGEPVSAERPDYYYPAPDSDVTSAAPDNTTVEPPPSPAPDSQPASHEPASNGAGTPAKEPVSQHG